MFRKMFVVMMVLPFICLFANNLKKEMNSPAELVGQYNEGIKGSVTSLLESVLDENTNVIVKNNVISKINSYDREAFLGLVQKKVVGNWKNDPKVSYLYEDGNSASVKLETVSGKIGYTSYVTCLKSGNDWKIVNLIISMDKISE